MRERHEFHMHDESILVDGPVPDEVKDYLEAKEYCRRRNNQRASEQWARLGCAPMPRLHRPR